ncbi:sensor domain-containing diguanylate cyclase [Catenovulum sediminis]|uniref:Diguanylate cyclase n=1 Tax=Catenovulum sediminis TaxID=1740262 RepID=A0ABV1REL0_9ALTE|nr:sensor domain-containing diguanylate cyclase [Catenovulum sediminis]
MQNVNELNLLKLLEHAHIGVVFHRWDTSILYANPMALALLEMTSEQIIGKNAFDPQWNFIDADGKKLLVDNYPVKKVIRSRQRITNETMGIISHINAEIKWFLVNAYCDIGKTEQDSFVVVTFNDISDIKTLFSFQEIVENTQDIVIVTEAQDIEYPTGPKIIYVNKAFENLTGYKAEEVIGETPRILQGTLTDEAAKGRIREALIKHQKITETLLNYDCKGRPYWIEINVVPLKNNYGEVTHFAAIQRNVSERKFHLEQLKKRNSDLKQLKQNLERLVNDRTLELQKAKNQLESIAFYDPLTDVPNRRLFIDLANKLIKSAERHNFKIAFGLLDIDDFKMLNDTYGHDVGDLVLISLAHFLKSFFRSEDVYCRYGGEEFAFAILLKDEQSVTALANRILEGIDKLSVALPTSETAHTENTKALSITASIGLKYCDPTTQQKIDLEKALKCCDVAMYQAKYNGKNQYKIHQ